jgi:hypothetical protein
MISPRQRNGILKKHLRKPDTAGSGEQHHNVVAEFTSPSVGWQAQQVNRFGSQRHQNNLKNL